MVLTMNKSEFDTVLMLYLRAYLEGDLQLEEGDNEIFMEFIDLMGSRGLGILLNKVRIGIAPNARLSANRFINALEEFETDKIILMV